MDARSRQSRPTHQNAYVYKIHVDGTVRYIGKGRNGRMHFHLTDACRTAAKNAANRQNLAPYFREQLVNAVLAGRSIEATKVTGNLSDSEAFALEQDLIGKIHRTNPGQLWNTIDERFMKREFLPEQWANPIHPLYRRARPLLDL